MVDVWRQAGLNVRIVVAPRKAAPGLEERSSTSMKERLREMLAAEDAAKQQLPMEAFHRSLPWRFCFCGGWMDLKWCNELWSGCAITINIAFHEGICRDECGLATSSRKWAAKLWNGGMPKHLGPLRAAQFLWGAENFDAAATEERLYWAGSQDHCGLLFSGVNKLCYAGGRHWPHTVVSLCDPADPRQAAIFAWLERVVHIVDIPFVSRPPGYNSQEVNRLKDPSVPLAEKVRMVRTLAEASEQAWEAILAMDAAKLGKALSDTMAAWEAMQPRTPVSAPFHRCISANPVLGDAAVHDRPVSRQGRGQVRGVARFRRAARLPAHSGLPLLGRRWRLPDGGERGVRRGRDEDEDQHGPGRAAVRLEHDRGGAQRAQGGAAAEQAAVGRRHPVASRRRRPAIPRQGAGCQPTCHTNVAQRFLCLFSRSRQCQELSAF